MFVLEVCVHKPTKQACSARDPGWRWSPSEVSGDFEVVQAQVTPPDLPLVVDDQDDVDLDFEIEVNSSVGTITAKASEIATWLTIL